MTETSDEILTLIDLIAIANVLLAGIKVTKVHAHARVTREFAVHLVVSAEDLCATLPADDPQTRTLRDDLLALRKQLDAIREV